MEEVDNIIFHSLRQIGCDIDEEVTSLKEFDTHLIVKAAVSCLELIQPGLGLPQSLPQNMAAKYKIGQMIAQACADNGYPGDIGYQTFLYLEEAEVRKVLMFLIEKLPKEQEKFVHKPTGTELLISRIKCKVKKEMNSPWLPLNCGNEMSTQDFLSYTNINNSPKSAWEEFCMNDLPSNSMDKKYLFSTIISLHSRVVLAQNEPHWSKWSSENVTEDRSQTQLVTEYSQDSIQGKRKPPIAPRPRLKEKPTSVEDEKQKLKEEEEMLTKEVEELAQRVQQLKLKKLQLVQDIEKNEVILKERKEKDALRARIMELMPEGEKNIVKLQQVVESASQKLVSLAAQWEKHRVPLIEEYRKSIQLQSSRMSESVKKAETVMSLREKRKELEAKLKNKDQILIQLQSENERNGKEVNRSAFTRRILEIINSIDKQNTEIEKVVQDTRDIQKEVNTLCGQLHRSFTVAEETIFRDAMKGETNRKAYKLFATLHSDSDKLFSMMQDTDGLLREIRRLEDQIEKEKSKNIGANLERIMADLSQMKVESANLAAQLKIKQNS